jgi:hypothetical protein
VKLLDVSGRKEGILKTKFEEIKLKLRPKISGNCIGASVALKMLPA